MPRSISHRVPSCALLAALFLAGCGSATPPITGCEAGSGITPDCRFQNPEEMLHALEMLPFASLWTWQAAEHWWREKLPQCIGEAPVDTPEPIAETADGLDATVIGNVNA